MEVLALAGGVLFAALIGYAVTDRIDRFLGAGGISSYWDAEEEAATRHQKAEPVPAGSGSQEDGCGSSDFEI